MDVVLGGTCSGPEGDQRRTSEPTGIPPIALASRHAIRPVVLNARLHLQALGP